MEEFEDYLDIIDFIPEFDSGYMKLYCHEPDMVIHEIPNEEFNRQKNLIGFDSDKKLLFKGWIVSDIFTYLYKEI